MGGGGEQQQSNEWIGIVVKGKELGDDDDHDDHDDESHQNSPTKLKTIINIHNDDIIIATGVKQDQSSSYNFIEHKKVLSCVMNRIYFNRKHISENKPIE